MNQMMINTPLQTTAAQLPVCQTVPLCPITPFSEKEMAYCSIPNEDSIEQLMSALRAAPQFSDISPENLFSHKRSNNLRVILLGNNDYYLRQAAAYLTAFSELKRGSNTKSINDDADEFWGDLDLDDYLPCEPSDKKIDLSDKLVVMSAELLDPSLKRHTPSAASSMMIRMQDSAPTVDISTLRSAGMLLHTADGPVLSDTVLQRISEVLQKNDTQDFFIAMRPNQMDRDLVEELSFTHGFQICKVGQADSAYLRRFLLHAADSLGVSIDPTADLDTVITGLRRYRGAFFTETDLETLIYHGVCKHTDLPLRTQDLMIQPYQSHTTQGRDALKNMIGLDGIKDAMNRLLASAVLEDRRRTKGIDIPPSCRNLAFSGNPGTGKSVTARLAAQIMQEEGCGSGRFVEAGREQLIGSFLGQTSPMIAELFRKARGGVLFIDEAGALISDGRDSYATEAVNALVRHMELEPETMVIFATYPGEMKQLLASNPGLSSRIAHVLDFPDYKEDTLYDIFRTFARREELPLSRNAEEICSEFFRELRRRKGKNFGNGREARRLFQTAKEELALRTLGTPDAEYMLSADDLKAAAQRLLGQESEQKTVTIGFHE